MLKNVVTGGAGFIGSTIVDALLELGHEVVVIDNESATAHKTPYRNGKAENHMADVADYDAIRPLFNQADVVFHLAAESRIQPSIENPLLTIKTNTLGTATVLQCAREAGARRVVYSSTSAAYGRNPVPNVENQPDDCLSPYSVSKVSGEKLCEMYTQLYGLDTVVLRYFNVYGEREPAAGTYAPVIGKFLKQAKAGTPLTIIGDGEQRRDFTNVQDVVAANLLAAFHSEPLKGQLFNIGSGVNYSVNEVAEMLSESKVYLPPRPGESRATLADNSKARTVLGWQPKIHLKDYLFRVK